MAEAARKAKVTHFLIGPRYTDPAYIGEGAYGMVVAALDTVSGEKVAIKRLLPFTHRLMCQRTLREIKILRRFNHPNIIQIRDMMYGPTNQDIFVVQGLMETDLHKVLKRTRLSQDHICFFTYQLCCALKYIHSANVLHRDLKPSNLLIDASTTCDLRVCDFGLSRVLDPEYDHAGRMTEYVATRWYRAPEIMLQAKAYTKSIDMWSVGCIFAEMFSNRPLFPGKNYVEQLNLIIQVVGRPSKAELDWIGSANSQEYVLGLPPSPPVNFAEKYPNAPPQAIELLQHMLMLNPDARISAEDALEHPYFAEYHDPADEITCDHPFQYEAEIDDDATLEELKARIHREVVAMKKDSAP
eukprot:m.73274 g.73274  ORF g.73274 m.73274 type:complete len:355 (+) comp18792_c0_seq1:215-1279(+)